MTITLNVHTVTTAAYHACARITDEFSIMRVEITDEHPMYARSPWWSMPLVAGLSTAGITEGLGLMDRVPGFPDTSTRTSKFRAYAAAAARPLRYGARLAAMYLDRAGSSAAHDADVARFMSAVFCDTFRIHEDHTIEIPRVAPLDRYGPRDHHPGTLQEVTSFLNAQETDRYRELVASIESWGALLRDVELTRLAVRYAFATLGLRRSKSKESGTLGAMFDVVSNDSRVRGSRMFFNPDLPRLSDMCIKYEKCSALPFWPGVLTMPKGHPLVYVCDPDDELRRVPWVGDVALTAKYARGTATREDMMRFPVASMAVRNGVLFGEPEVRRSDR